MILLGPAEIFERRQQELNIIDGVEWTKLQSDFSIRFLLKDPFSTHQQQKLQQMQYNQYQHHRIQITVFYVIHAKHP